MQALILAAGESSRFWPLNQKHKSLIKIMGRPLIYYTIKGFKKAGIKEIIIVQGPQKDVEKELKFLKELSSLRIKYVVQAKPKSTADAIWQARNLLKEPFLLCWAHRVDIKEYLPSFLKKFALTKNKILFLGAKTERPGDYGMVKFKEKKFLEVVEKPDRGKEPSDIRTAGLYIFPVNFFAHYKRNLIETINLLIKEKGAEFVLAKKEPLSLKYPWDLFSVRDYLFKNSKTKIYIGKNCRLSKNCYLRGFVSLGDNCKIGHSVEIKNSIIGDNSQILHLSYLGDSIIGENCNIGAGTITANLRFDRKPIKAKVKGKLIDTGREKFGCVLGNNTQTGINVSLMPGVLIGSNCQIGPNSVVFENIEDETNFYTRQNFEKFKRASRT